MPDSTLGLLFEISADPSKAQAALAGFQAQVKASTGVAAAATEDFGRKSAASVTGSSHAVRLLAEDMGLHLPRAITSAVAHMQAFQAVAATAFQVAVVGFFIDQLVKLISKTQEAGQAMGDFGKAAKAALKEISEEGAKVFTKFEGILAGKIFLEGTQKHLDRLNELRDAYKLMAEVQSGAKPANEAYAAALWKISDAARDLKLKTLPDVQNAIKETTALWAQQTEQLSKLEKDRTKKDAEEGKKRLQDAKSASAERLRLEHEQYENQKRAAQEYYRALKQFEEQSAKDAKALVTEQAKVDKAIAQAANNTIPAWLSAYIAATNAQYKFTDAQRQALPIVESWNGALVSQWQNARALVDEMNDRELPARRAIEIQIQRQADAAKREMDAVRQQYERGKITLADMEANWTAYTQLMETLSQRRVQAMLQEEVAQERMTIQAGISLLQTIGFRRAAAIVEAVWESAQGFSALARRDFWGAAQHFMSAAEYGIVAGRAGGAAAGAAQASGAGTTTTAAGGASAATQERQQVFQVIFQGPVYGGQAGIDELCRHISEVVTERDVNLVAYTVVRQPAIRA